MLGMLGISFIVFAVLHYGFKYYVTLGCWSFGSKVTVGWIGAWLGSPVLGHWPRHFHYGPVFIIPAILGALGLLVVAVEHIEPQQCNPAPT